MKKLYRKLRKIDSQIEQVKDAIEMAPSLPYYRMFGGDEEKEKDLQEFHQHHKDLLNQKSALLDRMTQKINCMKADVAEEERKCILEKNKELNHVA